MIAWLWQPAPWLAAASDAGWTTWIALAAIALPYGVGVWRLWRRAGIGRGIGPWRVAAFAAGMATLVIALASPLDTLADGLLAAHMTQHLLLIAVAPPLLVAGMPVAAWAWLWTPRGRARSAARRASALLAVLGAPATAFTLHAVTLWLWHLPGPFDLALRHEAVHAVEHGTLLLTASLLWWSAMRPAAGRGHAGAGVLLLLATAMQSGALGALYTTASRPWYATGSQFAPAAGLTSLGDQQLAGLLMWIPGGLIYTVAACGLFLVWFAAPARRRIRVAEALP